MTVTRLKDVWTSMLQKHQADPTFKVDDGKMLDILAAVGDVGARKPADVLAQLQTAPESERLQIVNKGLTPTEKKELAKRLQAGELPMQDRVRSFLNLVAGLDNTDDGRQIPGLSVTKMTAEGFSGVTKPNAKIELINCSAATTGRIHFDELLDVGKADAQGNFTVKWDSRVRPTADGDLVRVRADGVNGVLPLRVQGTGRADKNAEIALFRVLVRDQGDGTIAVSNINAGRQITEQGATIRLSTERNGQIIGHKDIPFPLDGDGSFPQGLKIDGAGGDVVVVSVSDGKNNKDFSEIAGRLPVPKDNGNGDLLVDVADDPKLHADELDAQGNPKFKEVHFSGPVKGNGFKAEDPEQGQLGDCYFPSAMKAMAACIEYWVKAGFTDFIDQMFKKNAVNASGDYIPDANGDYTVTFKVRSGNGRVTDMDVKVDGDLWVRSNGEPLYGRGPNADDPKKMKLWFPLVEKAYAKWLGSYDAIGNGGMSSQVFEDCTGKEGRSDNISAASMNKTWDQINSAIHPPAGKMRRPVSLGTYGESRKAMYTGSGVYADHSYAALDCKIDNGVKMVQIYNPWNESEPTGDGVNDGKFWKPIDWVCKYYETLLTLSPT
jgi:hypothetical protein